MFVHLAFGFDATAWHARWAAKTLIGLNEPSPYGYHRAGPLGCDLVFSTDRHETIADRGLRGALRLLLGFDLVHAYRNRRGLLASDVIWTHTESQHLAVLSLFRLLRVKHPPRVVAQSVWLIDSWPRLAGWKKRLYRSLLARADVMTFLSPSNTAMARTLFPGVRCEFVPFGISAVVQETVAGRGMHHPLRVIALGNDRHRDWPTLLAALGGLEGVEVRIASGTVDPALVEPHANVSVETPRHNDALGALYRWADLVVLPLKPNLHASGITVLQEAVLFGRPVICSEAGGLEAYFPADEVVYVEPGSVAALRDAVLAVAADGQDAAGRAARAQARMTSGRLGSEAFVRRHVELSHELLGMMPTAVA